MNKECKKVGTFDQKFFFGWEVRVSYPPSNDHGRDEGADESFPSLVGRDGEEGVGDNLPAHCDSADVGHDVVEDDERSWEEEPYDPLKHVVDHEGGPDDGHYDRHPAPRELSELILVKPALEGEDEGDKVDCKETEGNNVV